MKSSRAVDNRMSRHPRRRVGRTVPPLACRRNGPPDLVRGTRRARLAEACESAALPGWCRRPAPAWHARPGGLSVLEVRWAPDRDLGPPGAPSVTTSSGSASPSMRWADVYVPHVSPASMSPASMSPASIPASMRWADVYVSGLGPPEAPMAERFLAADAEEASAQRIDLLDTPSERSFMQ